MNIGKVILSTGANLLASYDLKEDIFLLQEHDSYNVCSLSFDINDNVVDCRKVRAPCHRKQPSPEQTAPHNNLTSWKSQNGFVSCTSDGIEHVSHNGTVTPYHYQFQTVPILGCYYFSDNIVTITAGKYSIHNLTNTATYSEPITPIKRCTSVIAGYGRDKKPFSSKTTGIDILFCDGSKVYHYIDGASSVIDCGRVLAFCLTDFGYMAAFETNWRFSPMHIFGDGPIDLENLEIPRNHTSSNEARLQLYSFDIECLDDHILPGHNEPNLLVQQSNIVCVSGFYKHVIAIFKLYNGVISHLKDISIGIDSRCAGLKFRKNMLLVLRRKFDSDNILLTFPSNSRAVSADVSVTAVNLDEHLSSKNTISDLYTKNNMFEQFRDVMFDSKERELPLKNSAVKRKKKKNRSYEKIIVTEEEVQKKVLEILEEYRKQPAKSFSDSELSDGTLELLADCRPRHPFIPIPVSSSSDYSTDEEITEEGMCATVPAKAISHSFQYNSAALINLTPVSTPPFPPTVTGQKSRPDVRIYDAQSAESDMVIPDTLILPSDNICTRPIITEMIEELSSANDMVAAVEVEEPNPGNQSNAIDTKLDRIIQLLEKQNSFLEIIARQKLT